MRYSNINVILYLHKSLCSLLPPAEPDAPQGPLRVSDVTPESAMLSWKQPANGPEDVENYVVEKLDPDTGTWQKVSSFVTSPHFKVKNLKKGGEYKFRVSAENKFGTSKPITSEMVIAKNPFGKQTFHFLFNPLNSLPAREN